MLMTGESMGRALDKKHALRFQIGKEVGTTLVAGKVKTMKVLLILAFVIAGCTHEYSLAGYRPAPLALTKASGKRVAVVLLPTAVQPSYTTSTDGHTFIIDNVPQFYEDAFRSQLRDAGATVQTFFQVPSTPFDLYVYPETTIEATGTFNHHCTVRFGLTLTNVRGDVLSRQKTEATSDFIPVALGPESCERSLQRAFDTASRAGFVEADAR